MAYPTVLHRLGLDGFELKTAADYTRIMDVWRQKTVEAREANNDVMAATLSQYKETIKKKWAFIKGRTCPRCKKAKDIATDYCPACARLLKGNEEEVDTSDLYHIEENIFITQKSSGQRASELTDTLRRLNRIGDSFLTNKSHTTIKNAAKKVGIGVTIRKVTIGEKVTLKMRYRVWRSDDLTPTDVNREIKQRRDAAFTLAHQDGMPQPEFSGPVAQGRAPAS